MKLRQLYLTKNPCYEKGEKIAPKGVMIHSTGANNPNLCRYVAPDDGLLGQNPYGNHWNQPMSRNVCVHAFIGRLADGSVACYQTLPWDMRGWHCGGKGNDTHISIEICEDDLKDRTYFEAVYALAAEVTAYLCRKFDFNPRENGVIVDHAEGRGLGIASDHCDIGHWLEKFGRTMENFRETVAQRLGTAQLPEPEGPSEFYETLKDVPAWAKAEIGELMEKGYLLGDGKGLHLSYDLTRTLVVLCRAMKAAGIL